MSWIPEHPHQLCYFTHMGMYCAYIGRDDMVTAILEKYDAAQNTLMALHNITR